MLNGHQLPGEPGCCGLFQQRFASPLGLHFSCPGEECLQVAKLLQELHGPLLADPADPGNVIRGVTYQGQIIHDLPGRHAEPVPGVRLIDPHLVDPRRPAAARVEQCNARPNQLVEVLVPGHDHDLATFGGFTNCYRADDVVGLVAGHRKDWNPKCCEEGAHLLDSGVEVGLQFGVEFFPGRFVLGILLGPERIAGIEYPDQEVRVVFRLEAEQKIGHPPGRGGVFTATGSEWSGNQGKKCAINQRMAIDQEKLRWVVAGHRRKVSSGCPGGARSPPSRTPAPAKRPWPTGWPPAGLPGTALGRIPRARMKSFEGGKSPPAP